jgi:hypothetical protein
MSTTRHLPDLAPVLLSTGERCGTLAGCSCGWEGKRYVTDQDAGLAWAMHAIDTRQLDAQETRAVLAIRLDRAPSPHHYCGADEVDGTYTSSCTCGWVSTRAGSAHKASARWEAHRLRAAGAL